MFSILQAGQHYLNTFPNQKKLNLFLPDYRLVRLVKFSSRIMPAFACFAIVWQFGFADPEQSITANSIITALFALSIPFQGLFWLGKRAKSPLPLSLLEWYETLRQKLIHEQHKKIADQAVPSYQDFANLLQLAEKTWGDAYFDEL
ncbi:terminus macrodomain insulation protein YfbV [Otariodibacter sp.]|uniref:terminus macrodomain insulation protein YfbV n=1 Tax=Otariodibacter sp. TaxID=3030919 RepID=UPI0026297D38|nr:terminus macrodomain insulation protein YfbV [Otariodibacter sp.]